MKKPITTVAKILLASVFFACATSIAQENVHYCHTNEKMDELRASDPEIAAQMEQSRQNLEEWTANYIANEYDPNARTAIYTIPVVFHVIHTNGPENISDAQILDALALLNADFNKTNTSWPSVHPSFLGIVADCQIEFKLARKKHNGQCTNGITRTYSQSTHADEDNDQVVAVQNAQGNWPGNKYLNIFIVEDAGGAAGYTTYPSDWSATSMGNGIKILHNYVGSIGTSNSTVATALSHEVGHWLNLSHCWGDSNEPGVPDNCTMDDGVSDTPNTAGWTSCNVNGISCGQLSNVENFMEYSYCSKMFTEGQKARMHAALESDEGDRDNLWTTSNLNATGVNLPDVLCQVNFSADQPVICAGMSVTFTDESFNLVTGTNWTFTGGSPASSTSSNPTITYNTPGVYSVTLQATDGSSTLTSTKTNYIIVHENTGESLPYHEGFESFTTFPDNDQFTIIDEDGDEAWDVTSNASTSGDKSLWLRNYSTVITGTKDAFVSGPIDLSTVAVTDEIVFDFRYAYRKKTTANDEWLRFYISKDCGETWILRKNIHGSALSAYTASSTYTPPDESAWYSVSVQNIYSEYFVENLQFKFEFESDGGNNIFIDDINLYPASMTGISEEKQISGLSIYPNPVTDKMDIVMNTAEVDVYSVSIVNILGETIGTIYTGDLPAGENQFSYSAENLAPGIYFIRVQSSGKTVVHKFIKN